MVKYFIDLSIYIFIKIIMEVPLNPINESPNNKITFRECAKEVTEINGHYHRKLVILMLMYWIFASFFISFQNYLYKKPIYHGCDGTNE